MALALFFATACSRYDDEPGAARLPKGTVFRCAVAIELTQDSRRDASALSPTSEGEATSRKDPPDACAKAIEKACAGAGAAPTCVEHLLYRKVQEDYDWSVPATSQ